MKNIDKNKRKEIIDYIEKHQPEFYWDYREELSDEQISKILKGGDEAMEVENEIFEDNIDHVNELERELIKDVVSEFGLVGEDEDEDEVIEEALEEFRDYIGVDVNIKDLIKKSWTYITLNTGINVEETDFSRIEYSDIESALDFLNINPATFAKLVKSGHGFSSMAESFKDKDISDFPDMPERDGNEVVKPEDFVVELANSSYGGEIVFLMDLNVGDFYSNPDDYKKFILKKGAEGTIHNYGVGACGVGFTTQKDLVIDSDISFNVDEASRYGVQETAGLTRSAWSSKIQKIETKKFGGNMKNRFKTNPIESLSTRELAEKAGVTMFDVRKHNMTREDLIAMVSEGNYAKGGGVGKEVRVITFSNSSHTSTKEMNNNAFDKLNEKLLSDKKNPLYKEFQSEDIILDSTDGGGYISIIYSSMQHPNYVSEAKIKKFLEYLKTFVSMDSYVYIGDYNYKFNNYLKDNSPDDNEDDYAKGGSVKSIASKFSGVASKYEGSAKEGYSVLVKDKNSDFSAWVDVWISGKDVQWDWNKYIFHTNDSKDMMQKSLQENIDIAEYASHIAIKTLEDKGLIHQDDKGEWSYKGKMSNGGGVGKKYYAIYDSQTGDYLTSGINSRSKEEAIDAWFDYFTGGDITKEYEKELNKLKKKGAYKELENEMGANEFTIDDSKEPFQESEFKRGGGLKQKSAQYGHKNYGVGDRQKHAKPVGYRYRKIRDPKTGKIRVVTKDDHQYYKSPSMKMIRDYEAGDKSARKMLYFEDRLDHSDKAPLRSLAKYAKGGSVTIDGKKAKYQVKYNLDGKEKIGYIVPIMTPSGHAIDIYYLYDKNKKLVKELRVAEANQLVKDKKIVNVKTYDVPMERLETDIEKSVKDMDYSERRNWIQDHIIPHLKSASLSWRDYQGGWYDYNDSKEEEKFLKDARTNADYKNEEDFNKNSGFKIAEDGWGISTKEGEDLEEVSSDNTYNWSYLGLVTWNIRIYQAGEEKFFLIAHPHKGGDVRGNYGDPIIFEDDSEESVMYKFREQVIDGNRVVSLEFKGGVNFTFDAEQDSDVDYFKLNDEPEKLKIGSPAELTLSTWKTFGGWHGDEFLTTIVDEFEREHPKKKKKECGGDIEMKDGGALQSLTTGQLATKAGMTMKEVHKFGYDRDDLIAMITEGNYRKGGGVGNEKEIQERLEYLRGELRAERISQGELIELQSLAKHIDPSDVELLEAAGVPEFSDGDEWHKVKINSKSENEFLAILDENGIDERNFIEYVDDSGVQYAVYEVYAKTPEQSELIKRNSDIVMKKGGYVKQKREQYTADDRGIDKYGRRDNSVKARPIGYRYRKIRDKQTGRLRRVEKDDAAYYKTPSQTDIKAYVKGDKDARRRIYHENRRDHSDKNPKSNKGY